MRGYAEEGPHDAVRAAGDERGGPLPAGDRRALPRRRRGVGGGARACPAPSRSRSIAGRGGRYRAVQGRSARSTASTSAGRATTRRRSLDWTWHRGASAPRIARRRGPWRGEMAQRLHHRDGAAQRQVDRGARPDGDALRATGRVGFFRPLVGSGWRARLPDRADPQPLRPRRPCRRPCTRYRRRGAGDDRAPGAATRSRSEWWPPTATSSASSTSSCARAPTSRARRPRSTSTSTRRSPTVWAARCWPWWWRIRRMRRRPPSGWRASRSRAGAASSSGSP